MHTKKKWDNIWKIIFMLFLISQTATAKIRFMSQEKLVEASQYIVVARVQSVSDTGRTKQWRGTKGEIIKNELRVIESIKGSLSPKEPFVIYTLKFHRWMEDNVKLPSAGATTLLFLERSIMELKPVNGIQGVSRINNKKNSKYSLQKIHDMVQREKDDCKTKEFLTLVDKAEIETQTDRYRDALESYREAYQICPMKDLEEQMAWLMGEI